MVAGGVMTGALTDNIGLNLGATIGLRADFRPLTLEMRARAVFADSQNLDVRLAQRSVGADITVLKLFDQPNQFWLWVAFEADWIQQTLKRVERVQDVQRPLGERRPFYELSCPYLLRWPCSCLDLSTGS